MNLKNKKQVLKLAKFLGPDTSKRECLWCGKSYEEHSDGKPKQFIPRVPCLLSKSGFVSKKSVVSRQEDSKAKEETGKVKLENTKCNICNRVHKNKKIDEKKFEELADKIKEGESWSEQFDEIASRLKQYSYEHCPTCGTDYLQLKAFIEQLLLNQEVETIDMMAKGHNKIMKDTFKRHKKELLIARKELIEEIREGFIDLAIMSKDDTDVDEWKGANLYIRTLKLLDGLKD